VHALTSQVDYAPTLLGLLRWTYPSRFYGRDVLGPNAAAKGRVLIGNYQKLGLMQDGRLAMLKPVRQSATLTYDRATHAMQPCAADETLTADAIAIYQTASWLFKHGRQLELTPLELARYSPAASQPLAARE
jgi:hypothetical protein